MTRPPAWLVLPIALAAGCAPTEPAPDGVPLVVATIHPIADLATRLGGDAIHVETLLPPRASLHTWEATPAQIRSIERAAGYITVGGGLDGWLDGMGAERPGLRRMRVTDGIALRGSAHDDGKGGDHEEGTGDPHVWLDPILVRDGVLPRLTDFLVSIAPAREAALRARSAALADSLTALDAELRAILAVAHERAFIATHDAWSYFAARYELRALGSLYESPGHEPSARGLAGLVDAARATGIGAVLAEPQLAQTAARALAGEISAEVVIVDPLGGAGVDGRDGYFDLMRFNARAFARALGSSANPGASGP